MAGMAQHMGHDAIDGRSAAALLVMKPGRIAQAGQDQAVLNPVKTSLVPVKPGDRSDRCRKKEKAIAQTSSSTGLPHRQRGHDGNSRKIVVRKTRVTDVTGNQ